MGPLIAAEWIDHSRPPVPPPTRGVTVEYGRYLARIAYCHGCHGPDLAGGGGPPPRATNLTSAAVRGARVERGRLHSGNALRRAARRNAHRSGNALGQSRADDGRRAPGALAIHSIGTSRLFALMPRLPALPRAGRPSWRRRSRAPPNQRSKLAARAILIISVMRRPASRPRR